MSCDLFSLSLEQLMDIKITVRKRQENLYQIPSSLTVIAVK